MPALYGWNCHPEVLRRTSRPLHDRFVTYRDFML
jgi:hypothetical protein